MAIIIFLGILLLAYGVVGIVYNFTSKIDYKEKLRKFQTNPRVYEEPSAPIKLKFYFTSLFIGLFIIIAGFCTTIVGAQEVGVVITPRGVEQEELHTGMHFIAPWNDIHFMDKTVWVYTCANTVKEGQKANSDAIWAPTKDGIKVGFDVSVSWKIDPVRADWIYQNVTENDGGNSGRYLWLEENVIRTKLKSAVALATSLFTPIQVYSTGRDSLRAIIESRVRKECVQYGILIDQVDLREVYYNPDYEKSINSKKLAEQEAMRLVEVTKQQEELKKQEAIKKDIAILKAQGESEALKIKGQSITNNPKIIELEWINKWNGVLPTYMLGSNTSVMMPMK